MREGLAGKGQLKPMRAFLFPRGSWGDKGEKKDVPLLPSVGITAYKSLLVPFDAREHQELEPCWSPALPDYLGEQGKHEESGQPMRQKGILLLLISSQLLQWGNSSFPFLLQGTRRPCWKLRGLEGDAAVGNRIRC